MHKLAEIYSENAEIPGYARSYFERLHTLLNGLDFDVLAQIAEVMDTARRAGRRIYFIANGGSAAIASHWVNDLVAGGYVDGEPNFRALCLSDNGASVTALGNDAGYDEVFIRQLEVHLEAGDLVFAMSVSGNSENIVRAVKWARENGAHTIGLCGFDGGRLKEAAEHALLIEATLDEYGPVEDTFSVLEHVLATFLTQRRGKGLHH